ncbi:hypothetical protein [Xanthomonas phage JGB6]|nr:hypothetical protein [Xanthomonas phage JGB6]
MIHLWSETGNCLQLPLDTSLVGLSGFNHWFVEREGKLHQLQGFKDEHLMAMHDRIPNSVWLTTKEI